VGCQILIFTKITPLEAEKINFSSSKVPLITDRLQRTLHLLKGIVWSVRYVKAKVHPRTGHEGPEGE
jgi:hypothetical protein